MAAQVGETGRYYMPALTMRGGHEPRSAGASRMEKTGRTPS